EISSNVTTPSPLAIYQWYRDSVVLQDKIDPSLIVRSIGTYQVNYSIDRCTYSASTSVTEPPLLYHNDRIACRDEQLLIATNLVPNVTYTWASGIANQNTSTVTVLPDTNRYHVSALDQLGCSASDSIRVIGMNKPLISVLDTAICNKDTINMRHTLLNASVVDPYVPVKYWTKPLSTDTTYAETIRVSSTGDYILHVRVDACEGIDTGKVSINALPDPVPVDAYAFCNYDENKIFIDAGASTGIGLKYLWNGTGVDGATSQKVQIAEPGLYYVTKTDLNNCQFQDTITVTENCGPRFFLPEAFIPGGKDLKNDKMYIFGRNFTNLKLTVFNRWGEVIYYTEDREKPWDGFYQGKQVTTGVYPYVATYEGLHDYDRGPYEVRGSVLVIKPEQ
ncbi:MAG TPA: gliding motility-associated C-terminal domain-containing protein, partial [Cytophagales bacterium]|nr:gliding motility-associated C-terminal domain-containing protein [Cytophagales bacterium]